MDSCMDAHGILLCVFALNQ